MKPRQRHSLSHRMRPEQSNSRINFETLVRMRREEHVGVASFLYNVEENDDKSSLDQ